MFKYATTKLPLFGGAPLFAAAVFMAVGAAQDAAAQGLAFSPNFALPDFSSHRLGWEGGNGLEFIAVPGSPPAITTDPDDSGTITG